MKTPEKCKQIENILIYITKFFTHNTLYIMIQFDKTSIKIYYIIM